MIKRQAFVWKMAERQQTVVLLNSLFHFVSQTVDVLGGIVTAVSVFYQYPCVGSAVGASTNG
jgi:hypothetical protein